MHRAHRLTCAKVYALIRNVKLVPTVEIRLIGIRVYTLIGKIAGVC